MVYCHGEVLLDHSDDTRALPILSDLVVELDWVLHFVRIFCQPVILCEATGFCGT